MQILFVFLLVISTCSYSQHAEHLFRYRYNTFVGVGYLDGKRIVSDMQVTPKDSLNREIHVKLSILSDWKVTDTLELDLSLDTISTATIKTGDGKVVEAVRYSQKGSDVFVDFEKPHAFTYTNQQKEQITSWSSHYTSVNFPEQLKKYQKVLNVYYEK